MNNHKPRHLQSLLWNELKGGINYDNTHCHRSRNLVTVDRSSAHRFGGWSWVHLGIWRPDRMWFDHRAYCPVVQTEEMSPEQGLFPFCFLGVSPVDHKNPRNLQGVLWKGNC